MGVLNVEGDIKQQVLLSVVHIRLAPVVAPGQVCPRLAGEEHDYIDIRAFLKNICNKRILFCDTFNRKLLYYFSRIYRHVSIGPLFLFSNKKRGVGR